MKHCKTMSYWSIMIVALTLVTVSNGHISDRVLEMLVEKVEALEQQGVTLQRQLDEQKMEHERREQTLVEELSKQKQLTTELQARLGALEQDFAERKTLAVDQTEQVDQEYAGIWEKITDNSESGDKVHETESKENRIRPARFMMDPEQPVAFHALLTGLEHTHLGNHQNIKFDAVQVNLGAAYHPQHGIFIAPQNGIYLFSTTLLTTKFSSHQSLVAYLMKNGTALGRIWAYGSDTFHDSSSMTAVAQLQSGDEVWVELEGADQSIWGDMYTAFSGAILYSL